MSTRTPRREIALQLLAKLSRIPLLQTVRGRQAVLRTSGLAPYFSGVDLEGDTRTVLTDVVNTLLEIKPVTGRESGLWVFIDTLIGLYPSLNEEDNAALRELARFYPSASTSSASFSEGIRDYLKAIVFRWQRFDSPLVPRGKELSQIAVPLLLGRVSDTESWIKLRPQYASLTASDSHRASAYLTDLLTTVGTLRQIAILGDPGTGKSVLLVQTAASLAEDALAGNGHCIPVLVPLASLGQGDRSAAPYSLDAYFREVGRALGIPELFSEIRDHIAGGEVLFLLDGLDEISSNRRLKVLEQVALVCKPELGNRLVWTSRHVGFKPWPALELWEILPLRATQQRELLLQLCGEAITRDLLRLIAGRSSLKVLASAPMTLTILALVATDIGDKFEEYCKELSALFECAIRILLEARHRDSPGVKDPSRAFGILSRASLLLHSISTAHAGREDFTRYEVESSIERAALSDLAPWESAAGFLFDLSETTNILYAADVLRRSFRFIHRSFREYLAARAMVSWQESIREERIPELATDLQWQNVLTMLAGMVEDPTDILRAFRDTPASVAVRVASQVEKLSQEDVLRLLLSEAPSAHDKTQAYELIRLKLPSRKQRSALFSEYLRLRHASIPRLDYYFIRQLLTNYADHQSRSLLARLESLLPQVPGDLFDRAMPAKLRQLGLPFWCEVNGGPFLFGADPGDPDKKDWVTDTRIISVRTFRISRIPITNRMYEVFDPMHFAVRAFRDDVPSDELDDHPVVNVTWYEAQAFCDWASRAFPGIRLPTEAEWEKAASNMPNGHKLRFPWGNDWDPMRLNCWESGPNHTTEVCSYPQGASPYGVLDMAGNVWEWCIDWFYDDYDAYRRYLRENQVDPRGALSGERKVDRGGGWYYDVARPCTFTRAADAPADMFLHCGFRVIVS